jgi:glutamyl-tRNA reductase
MDVGVVGINHKLADLRLREVIAKGCQERFGAEARRAGVALLSTCNRTELYFGADDLTLAHHYLLMELREVLSEQQLQTLYSFFGQDCLSHLARVTAGLDSAVVGETEIQGQVKVAYEAHQDMLPSDMHFLFQKALRMGKKVRHHLNLRPGLADTESVILEAARDLFGSLEERRILFVGASEINDRVLRRFRRRGVRDVTVCNRTHERALLFARDEGIEIATWAQLSEWHTYDVVIFGTKCPDFLINKSDVPDLCAPRLLVDLSVPRNVDPSIAHHPHISLYNVERIHRRVEQGRKLNAEVLERGEEMVAREVDAHLANLRSRAISLVQ